MKIDAQPHWRGGLSDAANASLSVNNGRISKGSSEVLMSPGYEDIDDDNLIDQVESILSECDLTDKLRQIEDDNRSKLGPRSIAVPWEERKSSLFAYFQDKDFVALEQPSKFGNLRPASIESAKQRLLRSSSAGLPYMTRKGSVLDEGFDVNDIEAQQGVYPCVLFTRTQEGGKTRNIWGYPLSDTLLEQRFLIPFLEVEKNLQFRSALRGPDHVDQAVTNLLLVERREDDIVYCVDFSGYDASISPQHCAQAFGFVASHFQRSEFEHIVRLFERFVQIPVYTPDGEVSGTHGVPSGSGFTNTIDSIVQWQVSMELGMVRSEIQGDDGVHLIPRERRREFEQQFESAGFTLNTDKSEVFLSNEAVYLQRYYHPNYRADGNHLGGVYSLFRALARLKYLERWTNFEREGIEGSDYFALRAIMILENCKHHPGFEKFVKMAQTIDKFDLRFTDQGLSAFSRAQESKARAGALPTSEMRSGISSFKSVQVLQRL